MPATALAAGAAFEMIGLRKNHKPVLPIKIRLVVLRFFLRLIR